jgi:hypothetical protein
VFHPFSFPVDTTRLSYCSTIGELVRAVAVPKLQADPVHPLPPMLSTFRSPLPTVAHCRRHAIDLPWLVAMLRPMRRLPFLRAGLAALVLAVAPAVRAADFPSKIEPVSDNTYRITVRANNKFTRDTDKLKIRATDEAREFCEKQGKHLKIVAVAENKSLYLIGDMASVTLTFKALALADPEFGRPASATAAEPSAEPVTNETLYADLLRLDDLHKKGILTDEEFKAEKKKVLDRSK